MRVYENGMRLAQLNGADQRVVTLFAFTHDMARQSDRMDPKHGERAAERIRSEMQGVYFELSTDDLTLLTRAVKLHSQGLLKDHLTVQTCWDADRLDLGRVGIRPSARRMCTGEAREPSVMEWAIRRSKGKADPGS
jgi:uncharacterized protein